MRVKICGITNLNDAQAAVRSGADELGFNFYRVSPRYIEQAAAVDVIGVVRTSDVACVGVFVNMELENILRIADQTGIDKIQLHGDETPEFVDELRGRSHLPVIKAFRIGGAVDLAAIGNYNVGAVLLDTLVQGEYGGSGRTFDWSAEGVSTIHDRVYLAGGLTPLNVASAIAAIRPYAVDTCSGVESAKGVKSERKMKEFIENAKRGY